MNEQLYLPLLRSLRSPEEAAATVRALREAGVDFIKIGDTLPPDLFDAVAAEAGRLGMPFAGHVPLAVGVVAASEAGQRSIEHLGPKYAVLLACSRREAELGEDRLWAGRRQSERQYPAASLCRPRQRPDLWKRGLPG